MSNTTRQTGRQGENAACDFLVKNGYTITKRNYTAPHGEIDIIAENEKYIVFVEVKYRSSGKMGSPLEAVDYRKRQKIMQTARHYLAEHHYREDAPVRFDCVGMTPDHTEWIRNAFMA